MWHSIVPTSFDKVDVKNNEGYRQRIENNRIFVKVTLCREMLLILQEIYEYALNKYFVVFRT